MTRETTRSFIIEGLDYFCHEQKFQPAKRKPLPIFRNVKIEDWLFSDPAMADFTESSDFEAKMEVMRLSELSNAVFMANTAPINTSPEGG